MWIFASKRTYMYCDDLYGPVYNEYLHLMSSPYATRAYKLKPVTKIHNAKPQN